MNYRQSWNIIAVFLLLLFGISAALLLHPKKEFSETENRVLAQLPKPDVKSILDGSFEADYEEFLTDQFVFRDQWIAVRTMAERLMLKQEVHDVYFGKDDYLIEKHTGVFQAEQASRNRFFLQRFLSAQTERFDADHMTVMIVPNAVSILSDKLPAYAAPYNEDTYLESLRAIVPSGTWFDAAAVLKSHADEEIYYRTDHHWKTLGAFYAFREWAAQKGIAQVTPEDYTIKTVTEEFEGTVASRIGITAEADSIQIYEPNKSVSYDLIYNQSDDVRASVYQDYKLETKDKYAMFFGGNYGLIEAQTNAGTGRRILLIKDSYSHCFAPFLLPYFDEVDLLDLRYFNQSLSEFMASHNYTDLMILQNAAGFAEDISMSKLAL